MVSKVNPIAGELVRCILSSNLSKSSWENDPVSSAYVAVSEAMNE